MEKEKYIRKDDPELEEASDFINYNIDAYKQTGDLSYRDIVFDSFDSYFKKYVSILHAGSGTVDVQNKDTKNFLRLFMKADDRLNEFTYKSSAGAYVHMIRRAMSRFSAEDIYHEVIVHFLDLVEKYKPITYKRNEKKHRISFPHYIQVNIRYKLCKWIVSKSKDAITGRECFEFHDSLLPEFLSPEPLELEEAPDIDLYGWVWGDDATSPFNLLTEMERYLLWLRYNGDPSGKKLSKREISDITGYHFQTITYRLNKIKTKIRKAAGGNNVLDKQSF